MTGDKVSSLKLYFLISKKGRNSSICLPGLLWELHDVKQLSVQLVLVTFTIMGITQLFYCCYKKRLQNNYSKAKVCVRKSRVSNSNFIAKALRRAPGQRVGTKLELAFPVMLVSDAAWSWSNTSSTSQTLDVMKSCPKYPSISLMQVKCVQVFHTFLMGCVLQNSYPLVNSPLSFSSFINIFPMGCLKCDSILKVHWIKISSGCKTRDMSLHFLTFLIIWWPF